MIEFLVSISIIVIIAAILTPTFLSAKRFANESSTKTRLHEFHLALMMYRQDWDETVSYGPVDQMGLPDAYNLLLTKLWLPQGMWKSPCGDHPGRPILQINYDYFPGDGGAHWTDHVGIYQDNMILMWDINCNDPSLDLYNSFESHLAIGVLLGGNIAVHRKPGRYDEASWWADPVF